jgi:lysozyme family protein
MSSIALTQDLRAEYEKLFAECEIREPWTTAVDHLVAAVTANQSRYQAVADSLNATRPDSPKMPWYFIAAIHNLEASLSFKAHLHNGDPLTARTVHVPRGRPIKGEPPFTWEESAIDSFKYEGLDVWRDWSLAGSLYQLEAYNGFGYRKFHPGVLSPYLWSGSNHYNVGKFKDDGVFDKNLKSQQVGGAVLWKRLARSGKIGGLT